MARMESRARFLTLFLLVSLLSIGVIESCFITNCPPGGKRSVGLAGRPARECMACGPEGRGRCMGPDICGGSFGVLMRTPETLVCRLEAFNPNLCKVPGRTCGSSGSGVCVSDGLCCSNESCSVDKNCQKEQSSDLPEFMSRWPMSESA